MSDTQTIAPGELLPCPFPICGGKAYFERRGTGRQSCIIACEDCGCRLETNEAGDSCGSAWNYRPPHPAPAADVLTEGERRILGVHIGRYNWLSEPGETLSDNGADKFDIYRVLLPIITKLEAEYQQAVRERDRWEREAAKHIDRAYRIGLQFIESEKQRDTYKAERDEARAQRDELERTIGLLNASGFLSTDKFQEARSIAAALNKPSEGSDGE